MGIMEQQHEDILIFVLQFIRFVKYFKNWIEILSE